MTGYYKPEWIKMYDFAKDRWGEILRIEIPKIPLTSKVGQSTSILQTLLIISDLEEIQPLKMMKISQTYEVSHHN
jgi:hypothetical protein